MAGDKGVMNKAMDSLMKVHSWRFTLHVDDKVDARLPHVPGEGLSTESSWREARVLQVHEKNFQACCNKFKRPKLSLSLSLLLPLFLK